MSARCQECGSGIGIMREGARFCSNACRQKAYRRRKRGDLPAELTRRDCWVRWERVLRGGRLTKRPVTVDGRSASSTDPATWSPFKDAQASTVGAGFGTVLNGDGLACFDLDHVLERGVLHPSAVRFLAGHDHFYVEVSPSGDGLHVWTHAPAQKGWRRTVDGISVEFYTTGRFMTVTGRRWEVHDGSKTAGGQAR